MKLSESAFAAPRVVVRLDPIEPLDRLSASSVDRGLIVRSPRPSRVLYSGRSHWPDTAGTVVSPARVRAVIDRIAADVDQLARARRVEDLDTAAPHRGPAVRPAGGTPSAARAAEGALRSAPMSSRRVISIRPAGPGARCRLGRRRRDPPDLPGRRGGRARHAAGPQSASGSGGPRSGHWPGCSAWSADRPATQPGSSRT